MEIRKAVHAEAKQKEENNGVGLMKAWIAVLILMVGAVQAMTPDVWQEQVRVGLLKTAYGWQNSPLLPSKNAATLYSSWYKKMPQNGCFDAQARDWQIHCGNLWAQGMQIDCDNANLAAKTSIVRTLEKSKGSNQYRCIYG